MLLERDNEQASLDHLLADSASGKGRVAVVTGAKGGGKTALLYSFAERAAETGVLWLSAIGSRAERDLPLGVVSQLFLNASIPAERAVLATQLLDSADVPDADWYDTPPGAVERLRITQGLCNAVVNLSKTQPVLVTIDDVHYADKASLWQLQFLIRRLTTARILLVLTQADPAITIDPALGLDLLHHPRCLQIEVPPLSAAGVTDLLRRKLDVPDVEGLGAWYHQVSGGNPLLVNALLDDHRGLLRGGEEPQRPDAPGAIAGPRLTRSVLALLELSAPKAREVARGLAVLGDGFAHRLFDLLDMDRGTIGEALDYLAAVGLLSAERFRHPIVRSAVLSGMAAEHRMELNHRAARLLHTEGAAPIAVARYLISARPPRDPWVLPVLREAAEQALLNDDAELAVRCLKVAAAICADEPQRAQITAMLARAEWRINPALAERHIPELTEAALAGSLRHSETHDLIRSMLWHGWLDPARKLLETCAAQAGGTDAETAAQLSIVRHWAGSSYPALPNAGELEPSAADGKAPITTTTNLRLHAARLLTGVLRDEPGNVSTKMVERVLQSVTLNDDAEAVQSALYALIYSDRIDRAAHWSELRHQEALERDLPTWRAMIDSIRAEVALRQGELVAAEQHARAALDVLRPRSWGVAAGLPLATLLHATTEMGKYDEAAGLLRQPVPDAMLETRFGLHYLYARGHYRLALNQVQAALGDFLNCGDLMRKWGVDVPALVSWRTGAAAAYLRLSDQERARKLMEEQRTLPGARTPRTRGISLRLFAATVELRQRPALLREAVDLLQSAGDGLQRAYALAALSGSLQALGEMGKSRMIGNVAHSIATACHAEPLSRTLLSSGAGEEAGAVGGITDSDESLNVLSEAEQRVASLAALGYSNREIARKIHITTSTVEQHLTRAYRKLKVNGRRDLPTRMSPEMSTSPA
ncbi:AAA family ATPase [Actinomadura sp. 7K507]|uniref:helix-turn-helix transcriptional regulator n=1 Tax=Actinomadura sp. 7K507 TaxID=2530365 RepID=UPI0010510285|nr:AAA family ATPase [Actinomadura sp. 7K507]TDC80022.1 helix-turn-helix transcriptional regulator [Actinomadura sp. 7K507]